PGVSLARAGSELVGTPTEAGVFVVTVKLSDASGSGVQSVTEIPFTVNARLELPEFFGLPSGTTVDAAVGSGGTNAVWSSTSEGDGALAVVAGSTLRLVGATGTPRTFDVS